MPTNIELHFPEVEALIQQLGLAPYGDVQRFFTNELFRASDKYTPFDNGMLKSMAYVTDDGTAIVYNSPYAQYHWHGKLMVDPLYGKGAMFSPDYGFWSRPGIQKVLTTKPLKYQGAPLRGPKWVDRAYIDNKSTLLASTERFANARR